LAKILYPDGVEVTEERQVDQIRRTTELLNQENVVIFEGTVQHGDWVARIDVIKKTGTKVELIEVKSKSFNSLLEKCRGAIACQTTRSWAEERTPSHQQRNAAPPAGCSIPDADLAQCLARL
jgi:regulator of RNase E activity RraB